MSVTTATGTLTVNAAFLQEIKDVNEELWQLLEEARVICIEPVRVRAHRRRLVMMLGQLRDQLAMHFALEEAFGYFDEPASVAPHLCEKAHKLRCAHRDLYVTSCELVEFAERNSYRGRIACLATEISDRFLVFYERLQEHEADEQELILQAYAEDIGVGD